VTIPDGSPSAPIDVAPIDDALEEGNETVAVTLSLDAAYRIGTPGADAVTIVDDELTSVDEYAVTEVTVDGSVTSGSLAETQVSDDTYEAVTELVRGNKSKLEHQWTFEVTGGSTTTFFVEAHHDGTVDDFAFEYSTDGASWTPMLTVSKTADDDTAQSFTLPAGTSGTLYVRVVDTDSSNKETTAETVFIDRMFIRSDFSGPAAGEDTAALRHVAGAVDHLFAESPDELAPPKDAAVELMAMLE
jgi:hypothetical protein